MDLANKNYFLITSSGQMGTFWLASQLNKHPEIFCSHSYNKPAMGAAGAPLKGAEGERQRTFIKYYFPYLRLKDFFTENTEVTDKPYVGNAHAYSIDKAFQMAKSEKLTNVNMVNLIRHPISHLNSLVNCIKNEWFNLNYYEHLDFVPKCYQEYGRHLVRECFFFNRVQEFDADIEKQIFVVALIHERGTAHHVDFAQKQSVLNIKYEDITTSRATMETLVKHLFGESLLLNYPWITEDVSYKKLNTHTAHSPDTISSIFKSWEPWKQKLYRHVISEDVFKVYTDHYYSFV